MKGPHDTRHRFRCRRILVPLDFSRRSLKALDYAIPLAGSLRAKISLLHVVMPDLHPLTHPVRQFHLQELLAESRRKLARLQAALRRRGLASEVQARVGLPFEQITTAAHELPANLLVLTTHGRRGLKRLWTGSTAEMVLRHAPCPVLVLRVGGRCQSRTWFQSRYDTVPENSACAPRLAAATQSQSGAAPERAAQA